MSNKLTNGSIVLRLRLEKIYCRICMGFVQEKTPRHLQRLIKKNHSLMTPIGVVMKIDDIFTSIVRVQNTDKQRTC